MRKLKLNTINHLKWRSLWSAAALCRFGNQLDYQRGRGLPHSKGFASLSGLLYSTLVCACFSQFSCRTPLSFDPLCCFLLFLPNFPSRIKNDVEGDYHAPFPISGHHRYFSDRRSLDPAFVFIAKA